MVNLIAVLDFSLPKAPSCGTLHIGASGLDDGAVIVADGDFERFITTLRVQIFFHFCL